MGVIRCLKALLGSLGENLWEAGVDLLLNRRNERYSCSFVMQIDRLGGTYKKTQCSQRSLKGWDKVTRWQGHNWLVVDTRLTL